MDAQAERDVSQSSARYDRRTVLRGIVGAAAGLGVWSGLRSRGFAAEGGGGELFAPAQQLGEPVSEYGSRAEFERSVRYLAETPTPHSSWSMTPLQDTYGTITPSSLHFERHHSGIPSIDPNDYRLMIHGMVDEPRRFTLADLKRYPAVNRIYFIECSGNTLYEWKDADPNRTLQVSYGLTSNSEWTGVPLSTLLREVGVQGRAKWLVAEGADGASMTRSIPMEKAWNDVLLAYGQNGEALRPAQGYPVRLLVPGWEGNISIKWVRRIHLADKPFYTREETSKYTDLLPNGTAREFTFEMDAKSVITRPSAGQTIPGRGFHEITGLAWSGRGKIAHVEVTTDGGQTWNLAQLEKPILPMAHTRFRLPWRWDGTETVIASRATDEIGYVQPTRQALVQRRGTNSVYHYNAIQTWHIASDGRVTNVHA